MKLKDYSVISLVTTTSTAIQQGNLYTIIQIGACSTDPITMPRKTTAFTNHMEVDLSLHNLLQELTYTFSCSDEHEKSSIAMCSLLLQTKNLLLYLIDKHRQYQRGIYKGKFVEF